MKTWPFYIKLIIPAILIPLFGLHSARPAFSQEETASKPRVKLTILFVKEKVACRDDGYASYDDDEPSKCKPFKFEPKEIENLKAKAKAKIQTEFVPPSEIKLEEDLFRKLRTYSTTGKATADNRRAIVLIFEWDTPQTGKVILERVSNYEGIPRLTWKGNLKQEKHWINHERADAFLPGYDVEWIMRRGEHLWNFKTGIK